MTTCSGDTSFTNPSFLVLFRFSLVYPSVCLRAYYIPNLVENMFEMWREHPFSMMCWCWWSAGLVVACDVIEISRELLVWFPVLCIFLFLFSLVYPQFVYRDKASVSTKFGYVIRVCHGQIWSLSLSFSPLHVSSVSLDMTWKRIKPILSAHVISKCLSVSTSLAAWKGFVPNW